MEQGRHCDAATIFSRLAVEEGDRWRKSVLLAREREARRADMERQIQDRIVHGRQLADHGDLKGAIALLLEGHQMVGDAEGSVISTLESEIAIYKRRLMWRRCRRMALIILGVAVLMVQMVHLKGPVVSEPASDTATSHR